MAREQGPILRLTMEAGTAADATLDDLRAFLDCARMLGVPTGAGVSAGAEWLTISTWMRSLSLPRFDEQPMPQGAPADA